MRTLRRGDVPDARRLALPELPSQDRLLRLVSVDVLESHLETDSELFRSNAERMHALVAELRERSAAARGGAGRPRRL